MEQKKKKIIVIVSVIALAVIAAVFGLVYILNKPQPVQGTKAITVTVVDNNGSETVYESRTDAEYLRGALEEIKGLTVEGDETEYGLYVKKINGISADYETDGAYWSFYVNGEYCNYGVDSQPVNDGDNFRIAYEKADFAAAA